MITECNCDPGLKAGPINNIIGTISIIRMGSCGLDGVIKSVSISRLSWLYRGYVGHVLELEKYTLK